MDKPMGGEIEWHTTDQQTRQRKKAFFATVKNAGLTMHLTMQTQRQGLYTAHVAVNFNLKKPNPTL